MYVYIIIMQYDGNFNCSNGLLDAIRKLLRGLLNTIAASNWNSIVVFPIRGATFAIKDHP